MKRTPTLIDLHQQDSAEPLVQPPTYPQIWTQPCSGQLLVMADAYPLAVALQPYAGTAMVGWTRSTARKVLVRVLAQPPTHALTSRPISSAPLLARLQTHRHPLRSTAPQTA